MRSKRSHKTDMSHMSLSRNHNPEKLKFDADSSRFHKPYKGLSMDLCWGKRKNRDESKMPSKKMKIIHKPSKDLSEDVIKKSSSKEGKKNDHCLQIHKPSKGLSRDMQPKKTQQHDSVSKNATLKMKIQDDYCVRTVIKKSASKEGKKNDHCLQIHKPSKGLSRDTQPKKTQQHGCVSTKMKIQDDYNSRKLPRNVKNVDQDASSRRRTTPLVQKQRRLVKKLPTKDAECKRNGRVLETQSATTAFISMEEYLKNSTEIIVVGGDDGDDCESWCKPLSEFVIPGPIPDFDAFDFDSDDALDFSQSFS